MGLREEAIALAKLDRLEREKESIQRQKADDERAVAKAEAFLGSKPEAMKNDNSMFVFEGFTFLHRGSDFYVRLCETCLIDYPVSTWGKLDRTKLGHNILHHENHVCPPPEPQFSDDEEIPFDPPPQKSTEQQFVDLLKRLILENTPYDGGEGYSI